MENYYTDERVLLAQEQSPEELMDILTFIKEVNFEIRDNLGFDVLWDSMNGKQCPHVGALLLADGCMRHPTAPPRGGAVTYVDGLGCGIV